MRTQALLLYGKRYCRSSVRTSVKPCNKMGESCLQSLGALALPLSLHSSLSTSLHPSPPSSLLHQPVGQVPWAGKLPSCSPVESDRQGDLLAVANSALQHPMPPTQSAAEITQLKSQPSQLRLCGSSGDPCLLSETCLTNAEVK